MGVVGGIDSVEKVVRVGAKRVALEVVGRVRVELLHAEKSFAKCA